MKRINVIEEPFSQAEPVAEHVHLEWQIPSLNDDHFLRLDAGCLHNALEGSTFGWPDLLGKSPWGTFAKRARNCIDRELLDFITFVQHGAGAS